MKLLCALGVTVMALVMPSVMAYPSSIMAPPEVSSLCPNPPGRYPLLLPNPSDCGSFYICSWNNMAFLQHCPSVLHFNPTLQVCDSPTKVSCVLTTTIAPVSTTTAAAGKATPAPTSTTMKTISTPASNITDAPRFNTTTHAVFKTNVSAIRGSLRASPPEQVVTAPPEVVAQCPPFSPEVVVMIPDPNSCSNFYTCLSDGSAVLQHCPSDLVFNPSLQVCDYPQNVHCKVTTVSSPATNKTTPVPKPNTTPVLPVNTTSISL